MKIALTYAYNGAKFSGSQTQPSGLAAEDCLNAALARVGINERVISSSRTDKGVHALAQVSATHCGDFWSSNLNYLLGQINRHAAPHLLVREIREVAEDFHPRYDARARSYRYLLCHDEQNAFLADFAYFCPRPDLDALNATLTALKGERDFADFHKSGSDEKSTVRRLTHSCAYRATRFGALAGDFTIIKFEANGFLRSQVRMMVANALKIATEPSNLDSNLKYLRSNPPRTITKIPAPACGLYLKKVIY